MAEFPVHILVGLGGLIVGFAFGALAWRTQFCVVGSLYSAVAADDDRGLRAIYLAMASAVVFTQVLVSLDLINMDKSIYWRTTLHWAGAILSGLLFGYGMVKTSGCGAGSLVNLGGGDIRSLIVLLIFGLSAYITLNGLTAVPRAALENATDFSLESAGLAGQGLDQMLGGVLAVNPDVLRWPAALLLCAALLVYVFRKAAFRRSTRHVVSGCFGRRHGRGHCAWLVRNWKSRRRSF